MRLPVGQVSDVEPLVGDEVVDAVEQVFGWAVEQALIQRLVRECEMLLDLTSLIDLLGLWSLLEDKWLAI